MSETTASIPVQAWAHLAGVVSVGPLVESDWSPAALAARAQIADAFFRFAITHDEARFDALASCFTADAVYRVAQGSGEPFVTYRGRDALRARIPEFVEAQADQRRHVLSNVLVDRLDLAAGTASAVANSVVTVAADGIAIASSVIYAAELRREADNCWRFADFFIGMDSSSGVRPESR